MNIETMLDNLLKTEGGYVDHPADKGGPTNYGITIPALNEYTGLRNNTQPIVFDMAVNHGPKIAVQLLQAQLLADGYNINKVDGDICPLTINASKSASIDLGPVFINNLINRRIDRYKAIIKHDPSQK